LDFSHDLDIREAGTDVIRISSGNTTFLGDVIIDVAGNALLKIDGGDANYSTIRLDQLGAKRWEILNHPTADVLKFNSAGGDDKMTLDQSGNATFAGTVTIGGNTAIHAGNFTTYTGLWSQVDNTSGRRRTNYTLGFQPNSNDYAGFEFFNQAGDGAGYLLVRANTDSGGLTYPANGIALVADSGHLNLVQRSSNSHGINLITNNGGSPIVALGLANNGNATFAGLVTISGTETNNEAYLVTGRAKITERNTAVTANTTTSLISHAEGIWHILGYGSSGGWADLVHAGEDSGSVTVISSTGGGGTRSYGKTSSTGYLTIHSSIAVANLSCVGWAQRF
jgi:hypothetical protein